MTGYNIAEGINEHLEKMSLDLEILVKEINTNSNSNKEDPTNSIINTLNYHLAAIQNIEEKADDLDKKINEIEQIFGKNY